MASKGGSSSKGSGKPQPSEMQPGSAHSMMQGEGASVKKLASTSEMMTPDQMVALMKQQPPEV